jgi:hypothetical protein
MSGECGIPNVYIQAMKVYRMSISISLNVIVDSNSFAINHIR